MTIIVNLDVMLTRRKMTLTQLSKEVDICMQNLSLLKTNKRKTIKFSTLSALCKALDCQPQEILEYIPDDY